MITTVTLLGPGLQFHLPGQYPYVISIYRDEYADDTSVGGYLGDDIGTLDLGYLLAKKNDRQRLGWIHYHKWNRSDWRESLVPDRVTFRCFQRDVPGWKLIIRGNLKTTQVDIELVAWGDIPELGNIGEAQAIHVMTGRRLLAGRVLPPARQLDISPAPEMPRMGLVPLRGGFLDSASAQRH